MYTLVALLPAGPFLMGAGTAECLLRIFVTGAFDTNKRAELSRYAVEVPYTLHVQIVYLLHKASCKLAIHLGA